MGDGDRFRMELEVSSLWPACRRLWIDSRWDLGRPFISGNQRNNSMSEPAETHPRWTYFVRIHLSSCKATGSQSPTPEGYWETLCWMGRPQQLHHGCYYGFLWLLYKKASRLVQQQWYLNSAVTLGKKCCHAAKLRNPSSIVLHQKWIELCSRTQKELHQTESKWWTNKANEIQSYADTNVMAVYNEFILLRCRAADLTVLVKVLRLLLLLVRRLNDGCDWQVFVDMWAVWRLWLSCFWCVG